MRSSRQLAAQVHQSSLAMTLNNCLLHPALLDVSLRLLGLSHMNGNLKISTDTLSQVFVVIVTAEICTRDKRTLKRRKESLGLMVLKVQSSASWI